MIKIRYGVFETNSSSVHSLLITQNDEIDKLLNNELLIYTGWKYDKQFIPYDEALELLESEISSPDEIEILENGSADEIYELMREYCIAEPFDMYVWHSDLEGYCEEIVSEHGDRILIAGRYGRDC